MKVSDKFCLAKEKENPDLSDNEGRVAEIKYDGTRTAITTVEDLKLVNRRGAVKNRNYPELTEIPVPDDTVIDGEVIVETEDNPGGEFNKVLRRANLDDQFQQRILRDKIPLTFIAFDILRYEGEDVTGKSWSERREILEEVVNSIPSEKIKCSALFQDLQDGWSYANKHGLEGIIVKKEDAEYEEGRSSVWRKIKTFEEMEAEAVKYEEHSKGIKVWTEEDHELTVNGQEVAQKVADRIDEEGSVKIDVGFLEETENGRLRHPTFRGIVK